MRVLITGGAGYIGSHLTEYLLNQGNEVTVLDNMSSGNLSNLSKIIEHPNLAFIQGDIQDQALIDKLIQSTELVYHLAAVVGVKHYVDNPLHVLDTNVMGTKNVLEAAHRYHVKVLFASTSEIYGKNRNVPFKETDDRVLGSTTVDRWCYSSSKAFDEHLCMAYHRLGAPITIVRYFNSYGPRANTSDYGGVAIRFVLQAIKGDPITIFNDGLQTRSFTYVSDTVRGTVLAATASNSDGQIYNIGNNVETSIRTLAETVKKLANSDSEITYIPYSEFYGPHYEDISRRVPDIQKAQLELGWKPSVKLVEGLQSCIDYYKEHTKG